VLRAEREHDLAVDELTTHETAGDFSFDLAPLEPTSTKPIVLSELAGTIFAIASFFASRPRTTSSYLLFGEHRQLTLGKYWNGKPHIHIVRFVGQCERAADNHRTHGGCFESILLRTPLREMPSSDCHLPRDSRLFEDYNAYVTSAMTLWIWSLSGLRRSMRKEDQNRYLLTYDQQCTVEFLEYGYMLRRSLLERAALEHDLDSIFSVQEEIVRFDGFLSEASVFGETRELLENGWKELKANDVSVRLRDLLAIRQARAAIAEGRATAKLSRALAVVLGLVAVPRIGEQILQPLWRLSGFPRPESSDGVLLVINVIATIAVAVGLWILMRVSAASKP